MGQCMSRKAAGAFAASAAGAHNRPSKKKHDKLHQSPDDNHRHSAPMNKNNSLTSKGIATSFGFKRRPVTAPSAFTTSNQLVGRRLAFTDSTDSNGNDKDTKSLTANIQTNGRSTPRLPPPKKEGNATQGVGRFGFRQTNLQVNRSNRVADLNAERIDFLAPRGASTPRATIASNNASQNRNVASGVGDRPTTIGVDNNRNRTATVKSPAQTDPVGRFTLQTNLLPKPQQAVRVLESKSAKTVANNNIMKFSSSGCRRKSPQGSSKDGSLTEDSGLGSHVGTDFDVSPQTPVLLNGKIKHRNLEMMVNGNTFELRAPDTLDVALPKLPSVVSSENIEKSVFQNSGMVRERTFAYERHIEQEIKRKISATSSEGFSDGSCQKEEETLKHKPLLTTQKSFLKPKPSPIKTFLKTRVIENKEYSSGSSEDIDYGLGGEALADEMSVSMSSSDESRDKDVKKEVPNVFNTVSFSLLDDKSFLKKPINKSSENEFRPVTLTILDSTLDAATAESLAETLLFDETSPVDDSLLSFTESIEGSKNKKQHSSDSKDINEKPSPSSPGTPTNGSNSFSLSDDKDFLIDDEYADQPALLGDKSQRSESTLIQSSTPIRKRTLKSFETNPLDLRDKGSLKSSNVSLDTLSPCDSIGSDDMMMDFNCSHSSLDDCDKLDKRCDKKSINLIDLDENTLSINSLETDIKNNEHIRDWTALLNGGSDKNMRGNSSRPRFIRSRAGTPSSVADSHSSVEGRSNGRISTPSGSLRRFVHSQGYESDDSIVKLDRTTQAAIKNDISAVKVLLFKLRGVLNEQTIEDLLLESETRNPFEEQMNGQNNGLVSEQSDGTENDSSKLELMDLRRQILFLQGQLEDKEKKVMSLENQLTKMCTDTYLSNSAPASTTSIGKEKNNAATQTDKNRRQSSDSFLTNFTQSEVTEGNLVSLIESPTKKTMSTKEASVSPMYQRSKAHTMIPRRSESRSRAASSSLT